MIAQENSFQCIHCDKPVTENRCIGTAHRNHCPFCLWSKHMDGEKPGDRLSGCNGDMKPIGLTFKHEGVDKYGKQKQGELMVIHSCKKCRKININRIAGDDDEHALLTLLAFLNLSAIPAETLSKIHLLGITILDNQDAVEVQKQLFGIERAISVGRPLKGHPFSS